MPRLAVSGVLPYQPEQLFDTAADVEHYPDFLRWWLSATIHAARRRRLLHRADGRRGALQPALQHEDHPALHRCGRRARDRADGGTSAPPSAGGADLSGLSTLLPVIGIAGTTAYTEPTTNTVLATGSSRGRLVTPHTMFFSQHLRRTSMGRDAGSASRSLFALRRIVLREFVDIRRAHQE